MKTVALSAVVVWLLAGCQQDRYNEGYEAGYAAGAAQANAEAAKKLSEMREELQRAQRAVVPETSYSSVSTTVCGGEGVNLNGKHFAPGKTGCVQVMSDGTVRRY